MEAHERNGRDHAKYRESRIPLDRSFGARLEEMEAFYRRTKADAETVVTDFIAGMTDAYALQSFKQVCFPTPLL